jgi:hypothetical protein
MISRSWGVVKNAAIHGAASQAAIPIMSHAVSHDQPRIFLSGE